MTLVICDSSILILISKLEILDLLIDVFKEMFIPYAVYIESVEEGKKLKKMDALSIEKKVNESKIVVKKIKNIFDKQKFLEDFNINDDEAEAIVLYLESKADLLGTDDYQTIKLCKLLHLNYFTSLLFIQRCFENNLLLKENTFLKYDKLNAIGWYKEELILYFKNKILRM